MTTNDETSGNECGLEALAKTRASLDLHDRERLDAALRAVRQAARERAVAARAEGRTDPDELRAEIQGLAKILHETVRDVDNSEQVIQALESVAEGWRAMDVGSGKRAAVGSANNSNA